MCLSVSLALGQKDINKLAESIEWNSQASVKIKFDDKVLYIDPYKLESFEKADYIFISHDHGDHLSLKDIRKIADETTKFIISEPCINKVKSLEYDQLEIMLPGEKIDLDNIPVEAVPAYNIDKNYHPKENNHIGFIITLNGVRIYHSGDTSRIPEMKNFNCDIGMLPLGQTYTMDSVEEAVEAARDIKAKIVIPFHYGLAEGSEEDAVKFRDLLKGQVNVIIKNLNN